MDITIRSIWTVGTLGIACLALGTMPACISDEGDPGAGGSGGTATGSGGSSAGTAGSGTPSGGSGGSSSSSGGSGGTSAGATKCAAPAVIPATSPSITDFEVYDGAADLATWYFPLGGDSASGILAGTFVYGDEADGNPEAAGMVAGNNDSMYALGISDTLAEEYGGGMGLWISSCLDVTAFSGISFWVRGDAPATTATITLLMEETTSSTPADAEDAIGTCDGTDDAGDMSTCKPPKYTFPVTDTWTQIEVGWTQFTPGDAAGTPVPVDGHNVWQIQFDIGVVWADDGTGTYVPTPAPYELVVDDLAFF